MLGRRVVILFIPWENFDLFTFTTMQLVKHKKGLQNIPSCKKPQAYLRVKSFVYDSCGFSAKTTWHTVGGVNYSSSSSQKP